MRLLFVISGLGLGGAEKQAVELARELSRRGHEVTFYTLNRDVPRRPELEGSGVRLIVDQKRARLDPALLLRLRAAIRRLKPDLVHGFLFDGDLYSRVAAIGTGIPVLNSERSDDYRLSGVQALGHRLTRGLARGVVANTWSGKAFAERLFRLPARDVHVVWNGIDVAAVERQAGAPTIDCRTHFFGSPGARLACLVGSICPAKDYGLALEAAARLIEADSTWRVLFVGDQLSAPGVYSAGPAAETGTYKAAIFEHYERLGLKERIKFAGRRTDVPAILRQCDVLYVTSEREGFPNVVLEAMSLGVPVVSTEYSDIRRILPCPGQVVARRSAEGLAHAMRWAHRERATIAARQRQWVQAHATIAQAAANLEQVYRAYAGAASPARPAPLHVREGQS